jgi:hypothetical protein
MINYKKYNVFIKDYEEIKTIKLRSKITACMAIFSNNLNEGNNSVKEAISKSKFDKSKSYDKIFASMLTNCVDKIKDDEIDNVIVDKNRSLTLIIY